MRAAAGLAAVPPAQAVTGDLLVQSAFGDAEQQGAPANVPSGFGQDVDDRRALGGVEAGLRRGMKQRRDRLDFRRQVDGGDRQPKQQVLAEAVGDRLLLQPAVGGGQDAEVSLLEDWTTRRR